MIYADYNGSAPLLPAVREYVKKRMDSTLFANPNAIHSMGQKLFKGIENCRGILAKAMGCYPDQIIFNSGASEGLSQILFSILEDNKRKTILMSPIEHAVLPSGVKHFMERNQFQLKMIEIDQTGLVSLKHLQALLDDEVAVVIVMAANNETGVIQPFQDIARSCGERSVPYLCDTTQLIGKAEFNFKESGVDYAVCSGHKVGALTGSGFLIAKDPTTLHSMVFGKNQEKGLRGGTQNYLGIETLAIALDDFSKNRNNLSALKASRLKFEKTLKDQFKEVVIIGEGSERLAGTTLIGFPGLHGQAVQIELESNDIFVTTSAACADNQPETSEVLRSMGIDDKVGRSVVRISLSYSHGEKEYLILAQNLIAAYNKLMKIQSF
jgi:cysteine desulfurase